MNYSRIEIGTKLMLETQVYWAWFINTYEMPILQSLAAGGYYLMADIFNTALALTLSHSLSSSLGWHQYIGIVLFAIGIYIEVASEHSRRAFKSDPINRGKFDGTGLWVSYDIRIMLDTFYGGVRQRYARCASP